MSCLDCLALCPPPPAPGRLPPRSWAPVMPGLFTPSRGCPAGMVVEVLQVPAGEWLLQTAAGSVLGRQVIQVGQGGSCCSRERRRVEGPACIVHVRLSLPPLRPTDAPPPPITTVVQAPGHQDH